jgi:hypothetical protein
VSTRHQLLIRFVVRVLHKLRPAAKVVVERDMVLCNTLIFEYATHPRQDHSSSKLCYLLCDFFAPLLVETGADLPNELLQFRHKGILTQRLLTYDNDKQTKVAKYFCNFGIKISYCANFVDKACGSSEDTGGA